MITSLEDRALAQAKTATEWLAKHKQVDRAATPLFGIPLGVKDVLAMEGIRTTCASKMLDQYKPPYTATVIEKLEHAGAISMAKLNMDEFAMGSSNENSAYGNVAHPTHPDRVAGGSSGGSATAVGAGLCPISLGTDTGGSIRMPASFCGVVGVKPTYGRVSRYGLVAFASSLDQIGVFSNTIEDAATVLDVMAGHDERDSTSMKLDKTPWAPACGQAVDWKKVKVGVPKEYFIGGSAPDVEQSVQNAIAWFKKQGAQLVEVSLPHTEYAIPTYYMCVVSESSSNLARFDGVAYGERAKDASDLQSFYEQTRTGFGPEVKRRIILGTYALSSGYYDAYYKRACQVRRLIRQDFDQAFTQVDFIVSPVSPVTAFKQGEKSMNPLELYLVDAFTAPASLAGLPALSVPCGQDADGLSVGLHMIGKPFAEEQLLHLASGFQKGFEL